MEQSQESRFKKPKIHLQKDGIELLVHLSALFLLIRVIWLNYSGSFFIDPIRQTTTHTGKLAITLLLLSLAVTPFHIITGWSRIMRLRKPLGMYAFWFALIHGLTYVGWDYRFNVTLLLDSLQYSRYILAGVSAFLILLVLAITSLKEIRKGIGKSWRYIQKSVYAAGILAVIHVLWLRKSPLEVLPLVLIVLVLLLIRVPWLKGVIIRLRQSITKGSNPN